MDPSAAPDQALRLNDPGYPGLLREISSPPDPLHLAGALPGQPAVAVVGSRACSRYGREVAYELAAALARRGVSVVSGLARGIDAAAHEGALAMEGHTVAVLPGGLRPVYPARHRGLAERIRRTGALVAEHPVGTDVAPWHFPQRNRIIAGLCEVTVVVEAAARSGARITADLALEAGRDVLVVPGPITSRTSVGCNQLLAGGAFPLTSVDDVINHLGTVPEVPASASEFAPPDVKDLAPSELRLLECISPREPRSLDELAATLDLPIGDLLVAATALEIRGLAVLLPGNRIEAHRTREGSWPG